jgi:hypothetical protein
LGTLVEDSDFEAVFAEFRGTGERRGTSADAGDSLGIGHGFVRKFAGGGIEVLHGVTLQEADGDGLVIDVVIDTSALTENLHGTDARTAEAENVCVENGFGCAEDVASGDFLDETRHVNVSGTGAGTGRIKAEQAAVGFRNRCLWS